MSSSPLCGLTLQRIKIISKTNISPLAAGYRSSQALNANLAELASALDNTLSRDGTGPNQMEADLDMNSQRILNLPLPTEDNDPVRLIDITEGLVGAVDTVARSDAQEAIEIAEDAASAVAGKADVTDVANALALKANTSTVTDLSNTVATKADASTVSALATTVASKADTSTVSSLASTVATKADSSTVSALATTVAAKAPSASPVFTGVSKTQRVESGGSGAVLDAALSPSVGAGFNTLQVVNTDSLAGIIGYSSVLPSTVHGSQGTFGGFFFGDVNAHDYYISATPGDPTNGGATPSNNIYSYVGGTGSPVAQNAYRSGYAAYLEGRSRKLPTSITTAFPNAKPATVGLGLEMNWINESGVTVPLDPENFIKPGSTTNVALSAGRPDLPLSTSNSAAIVIAHNGDPTTLPGASYDKGIIFTRYSMNQTGDKQAISLYNDHKIAFYEESQRKTFFSGPETYLYKKGSSTGDGHAINFVRQRSGGVTNLDSYGKLNFGYNDGPGPQFKAAIEVNKQGSGAEMTLTATNSGGALLTVGFAQGGGNSFGPSNTTGIMGNGTSSNRWYTIFLTVSPDVSSDKRLKTEAPEATPELLQEISKIKVRQYTRNDQENDLIHSGVFAQEVIEAFERAGVDWKNWNVVKEGEDGYLSVVYDELYALKIQALEARLNG